MDLYRYFHPHHNPRLSSKPLRLLEIGELIQAAVEFQNAVRRAQIRMERAPNQDDDSEKLANVMLALDFVIDSLNHISERSPEDDIETMYEMLEERKNAPGWENWTRLLRERLSLLEQTIEVTSMTGNQKNGTTG